MLISPGDAKGAASREFQTLPPISPANMIWEVPRTAKGFVASEDGDIFVVKAGPAYELLATNAMPTAVTQPAPDLTFRWLLAGLVKHAEAIVLGSGQ